MNKTILFACLTFITIHSVSCKNNEKKEAKQAVTADGKEKTPKAATKTILFFGNSLTAGYGLDPSQAFPAQNQNNMTLIPFLLEGVGGDVKLNQQDGIHPNAEGEKIVTENVWRKLQSVLQ